MKILLIEPAVTPFDFPTKVFAMPPQYHLEILAAGLVSDHAIQILDMRIENSPLPYLLKTSEDIWGQ